METLESQVFPDGELDRKTLTNLLETLDHINIEHISREDYNAKKGNILKQVNNGKEYTLYLPKDLKVGELASIIRRINKLTFGDNLPLYSSSIELKGKLVFTFDYLSEKEGKDGEKIEKALKKYYKLYVDLFGEEEASKLNDKLYRKEVLRDLNSDKLNDYGRKIEEVKLRIGARENLDDLKQSILQEEKINDDDIFLVGIEQLFSSELIDHFGEAFLEKGVNDIRFGLEIITRAEQEKLIERLRGEGFEEEIKPGEIIFKKGDDIIIIKNNGWEEEAKKLRDYIGIDKFKQELEEVRASGDKEKIAKMELRVTSELLMHISSSLNYYLGNNDINGYQPKKILETKQIVCVGFSIIGHSLLSELGIKHNGLNLLVHSALEVIIGDKKYLFDATQHNYLLEFKEEKILYYTKMELVGEVTSSKGLYVSGDVEKILLSQIYTNKGNNLNILGRYEEAIKMYDKAIKLNPNNDLVYSNKGKAFYRLGKERMGKLYEFTGNLLSGYYFHFDVLNGERKQIRDFIKEKNYEGLRLYLLSLEKLGEE